MKTEIHKSTNFKLHVNKCKQTTLMTLTDDSFNLPVILVGMMNLTSEFLSDFCQRRQNLRGVNEIKRD